jgi:voltage-gated potassium channel
MPTRVHHRFKTRTERAITGRHVFRYLAIVTLVLAVGAGVLVWIIDRRDFATLQDALWWSVQTLSTVGYGDIVPTSAWGRLIGTAVIVLGVTFLSFLTAIITSNVVSADQDEREAQRGSGEDTQALLREVVRRLDSIEDALADRTRDGSGPG